MAKSDSSYIQTPMTQQKGSGSSPQPSGNVCTSDEKQSTVPLPSRTSGAPIKEILYDENGSLPSGSIRKGK